MASEAGYSDEEFEQEIVAKPMFAKDKRKTGDTRHEQHSPGNHNDGDGGDDLDDEEDEAMGASESEEDADERIEKLRIANQALRKQLKDFAKVFEASMNSTGKPARLPGDAPKGTGEDGKRSLRAIVQSKQRQVQSLQKKLEMYRKSNNQLKRQIQHAYTADRVVQMGNENKEKEKQIQQLIEENRGLQAMQRNQAKKIQRHQVDRDEWPARLSGLQDELRVTRETLRKYKDKARAAEEETAKQHELIIKLQEKNRELRKEIERYEASNGKAKTKDALDIGAHQDEWDKERDKLEHAIKILEKAHKQERAKAAQAAKRAEDKLKEHQEEVDRLKTRIEEKEKDMRYQVIQIKRLKRGLRELAMGDGPLPLTDSPWSANMAKFLNGVDDDNDDLEASADHGAVGFASSPKSVAASPRARASPKPPSQGRVNPAAPSPRVARAEQVAASQATKAAAVEPAAAPGPEPTDELEEFDRADDANVAGESQAHGVPAEESEGGPATAEDDEPAIADEPTAADAEPGAFEDEPRGQSELPDAATGNEAQSAQTGGEEVAATEAFVEAPGEEPEVAPKPQTPEKKSAFAKPNMGKKKKKKAF